MERQMANRITREIKSRNGLINGRKWVMAGYERNGRVSQKELTEITDGWYMRGHWTGKRRDPITMLIRVGILRRQAAATPAFHLNRRKLIAEARSVLQAYRAVRREEQRQQLEQEAA
jgi:hypothetical protein